MKVDYEQIKIFPTVAPGSEGLQINEVWSEEETNEGRYKLLVDHVIEPTIYTFIPESSGQMLQRPAVLIVPGGAFKRLVINIEGFEVAEWLKQQGFAAFVLKTRLPSEEHNNRIDVPLIDAQRAIRLIRSRAKEWNIDPDRVGVMGFSAGGNIASMLSTCFDRNVYSSIDDVDRCSARPDFSVLCYPAISAEMEIASKMGKVMGDQMHNVEISRMTDDNGNCSFLINGMELGNQALEQFNVPQYLIDIIAKYSTDLLVNENTPQTFIMETDLDTTTMAEHSIRYYMACRKARVSAELHVFSTGKHGFGLGDDSPLAQTGQWKSLFMQWAKTKKII